MGGWLGGGHRPRWPPRCTAGNRAPGWPSVYSQKAPERLPAGPASMATARLMGLDWVGRWAPGRLSSGGPGQLPGWQPSGSLQTSLSLHKGSGAGHLGPTKDEDSRAIPSPWLCCGSQDPVLRVHCSRRTPGHGADPSPAMEPCRGPSSPAPGWSRPAPRGTLASASTAAWRQDSRPARPRRNHTVPRLSPSLRGPPSPPGRMAACSHPLRTGPRGGTRGSACCSPRRSRCSRWPHTACPRGWTGRSCPWGSRQRSMGCSSGSPAGRRAVSGAPRGAGPMAWPSGGPPTPRACWGGGSRPRRRLSALERCHSETAPQE